MDWRALRGHSLVLLATLAGILGMGLVFDGVLHGNLAELTQGLPLLFLGLFWAGRELGRSMLAARSPDRTKQRAKETGSRAGGRLV